MLWERLKEQSTWTGIAITGLTIFQATGDWKGAALAVFGGIVKMVVPDTVKK